MRERKLPNDQHLHEERRKDFREAPEAPEDRHHDSNQPDVPVDQVKPISDFVEGFIIHDGQCYLALDTCPANRPLRLLVSVGNLPRWGTSWQLLFSPASSEPPSRKALFSYPWFWLQGSKTNLLARSVLAGMVLDR